MPYASKGSYSDRNDDHSHQLHKLTNCEMFPAKTTNTAMIARIISLEQIPTTAIQLGVGGV
jgi:hypothetical protein